MRNLALILLLAISPSGAEETRSGLGAHLLPANIPAPVADATTDETLTARQESERFGGLAPEEKSDHWSLENTSTFLSIDGYGTVLPRGAVLFIPAALRGSTTRGPEGEMIPWVAFLNRNRALITTVEVTMDQILGKDGFTDDASSRMTGSKQIVVGTLRGSPISVHARPSVTASSTP